MKINGLLKEYLKEIFLFVVTSTFSWWLGGFNMLLNYFYENTYEISRGIVAIAILLTCLLSS